MQTAPMYVTALSHRAADEGLGRVWSCMCAACRSERAKAPCTAEQDGKVCIYHDGHEGDHRCLVALK